MADNKETVKINFPALHNNVLYSFDVDLALKDGTFFQNLNKLSMDCARNSYKSGGMKKGCLQMQLDWDSNKSPFFGIPSIRGLLQLADFYLPKVDSGKYQVYEKDGLGYEKGLYPSSWNFAHSMSAAGLGTLHDLTKQDTIDYNKFPIGTIFHVGPSSGYNKYIKDPKSKDWNGNPFPTHSFSKIGIVLDSKTGRVLPLIYDYGHVDTLPHLYNRVKATYAFVPNDREEFTTEKIIPRYNNWLNRDSELDLNLVIIPKLSKYSRANSPLSSPEVKQAIKDLNLKLNIGSELSMKIARRLQAIGALESELDYSLGELPEYLTDLKSLARNVLHKAPNYIKTIGKLGRTVVNQLSEGVSEGKAAWEIESDIYDLLSLNNVFQNLPEDAQRKLINEKFNEYKGVVGKNIKLIDEITSSFDHSHGPYQIKDDSSLYTGENPFLQGYAKIIENFDRYKKLYPNLTDDLLLDIATVSWNAPSKINKKFIDYYISGNTPLLDVYLESVKNHERILYNNYELN